MSEYISRNRQAFTEVVIYSSIVGSLVLGVILAFALKN
jgi:hypothetical protein